MPKGKALSAARRLRHNQPQPKPNRKRTRFATWLRVCIGMLPTSSDWSWLYDWRLPALGPDTGATYICDGCPLRADATRVPQPARSTPNHANPRVAGLRPRQVYAPSQTAECGQKRDAGGSAAMSHRGVLLLWEAGKLIQLVARRTLRCNYGVTIRIRMFGRHCQQ